MIPKRAIVTGGSNGIGSALCARLASNGAAVYSLDQAAATAPTQGVTHLHCDISKLDDVRSALARTGGRIDVLVLNAGVIRRGPVLSHPENEFDLLFDVNAKGAWLMLKEASALLSPKATVLHVSSYRAGQDVDDPGLYAASKAAGEHLARCAAIGADWTLKIARLGPFDTAMARDGSPIRPAGEAAELLLRLIESNDTTASYRPDGDAYDFA